MPVSPPTVLTIAGVCFVRSGSGGAELLTVRKRGTSRFMLPGGKLDPGETPEVAAVREVAEEIGLDLTTADLDLLGSFDEEAANEADTRVAATVYTATLSETPEVAREIEALRWQPLTQTPRDVAPLLARHVLPALRARHPEGQHAGTGRPAG
ncbi:NUDIX hydrolase [Ruania albidiflava]|uniref:NUDIX hydrolase n=1 Tax=Ruania albidiflava TaxID=366586 RepID=UPI0023F4A80C|nr:NUDIX domain-containing protein [Ruania albidiflava]